MSVRRHYSHQGSINETQYPGQDMHKVSFLRNNFPIVGLSLIIHFITYIQAPYMDWCTQYLLITASLSSWVNGKWMNRVNTFGWFSAFVTSAMPLLTIVWLKFISAPRPKPLWKLPCAYKLRAHSTCKQTGYYFITISSVTLIICHPHTFTYLNLYRHKVRT